MSTPLCPLHFVHKEKYDGLFAWVCRSVWLCVALENSPKIKLLVEKKLGFDKLLSIPSPLILPNMPLDQHGSVCSLPHAISAVPLHFTASQIKPQKSIIIIPKQAGEQTLRLSSWINHYPESQYTRRPDHHHQSWYWSACRRHAVRINFTSSPRRKLPAITSSSPLICPALCVLSH